MTYDTPGFKRNPLYDVDRTAVPDVNNVVETLTLGRAFHGRDKLGSKRQWKQLFISFR